MEVRNLRQLAVLLILIQPDLVVGMPLKIQNQPTTLLWPSVNPLIVAGLQELTIGQSSQLKTL
jgi:hypothetical protein